MLRYKNCPVISMGVGMRQFPHHVSQLCHHMNFSFGGKTRGGLCAQEVGTWAWIHHAQVPWGDISMISQAEKPWGVSQPGGVSRHFTPVHLKGPDSFVST